MIDHLSSLFVSPDTPVLEAMQIINKGAAQIALVVDNKNILIAVLSDGDIRRGLLHGYSLNSSVSHFMKTDFISVPSNHDRIQVLNMMRQQRLAQIPVIDSSGQVSQLLLMHELLNPESIENSVVIMAGGLGTRLRPYTDNCPKPMLTVSGKPILEHILEQFTGYGFRKFYFSVNYLKEQIIDYFQDGTRWSVNIEYLIEDQPLGTAGSLSLLPSDLDKPFMVINGDVLTRFNPQQVFSFHSCNDSSATICSREQSYTIPYGIINTSGISMTSFEEKPTFRYLVNAGIYIIDPILLSAIPQNKFLDMPTFLLNIQSLGHQVNVCAIHEYWLDVGKPETLNQAFSEWLNSK